MLKKIGYLCCLILCSFYTLHADYVLCVGIPGVDIIKRLNAHESLEGEGGSMLVSPSDLHALVTEPNGVIEKAVVGGSAANFIRALGHMGMPTAMSGKVGNDSYKETIIQAFQRAGVTPLFNISYTTPTQQVLCLIHPNGERTFRCCLGAGAEFQPSDLNEDDFKKAMHVHAEGYLLRNKGVVEQALRFARQNGATTSLDVGCYQLAIDYRDMISHLLGGYIDIIFANADEAKALTGLEPYAACDLLQTKCPYAVVLIGNQGCLIGHQGEILHVPTSAVPLLDAVGAGDYFGAGFIYGLLKGYSLEQCGKIGNKLGGAIVQVPGASLPDAQWEKLKQEIGSL